ncbi:hypothetical protein ACLOJK_037226 [Asimina triloba]
MEPSIRSKDENGSPSPIGGENPGQQPPPLIRRPDLAERGQRTAHSDQLSSNRLHHPTSDQGHHDCPSPVTDQQRSSAGPAISNNRRWQATASGFISFKHRSPASSTSDLIHEPIELDQRPDDAMAQSKQIQRSRPTSDSTSDLGGGRLHLE